MAEQRIPAKTIRSCDRCRVEMTDENTVLNRGWMTRATMHRFIRKVTVMRFFDRRPEPVMSDIHFCDGCWWEFDRLFCQGQAIRPAPGVRIQPMLESQSNFPTEGGRSPLTLAEAEALAPEAHAEWEASRYECSQEPHPGVEFYGDGGCAECGFMPPAHSHIGAR